jgi:hypothetical protein
VNQLIDILVKRKKDVIIKVNDKYNFEIRWFYSEHPQDESCIICLRTEKDNPYSYTHQKIYNIRRVIKKLKLLDEFIFKLEEEVLKGT